MLILAFSLAHLPQQMKRKRLPPPLLQKKPRNGSSARKNKDEWKRNVKLRLPQRQPKLNASVGIVKRSRGKKKIGVDARSKKKNEDVHHVHLDRKFSIIPFIDRFLTGWCAD